MSPLHRSHDAVRRALVGAACAALGVMAHAGTTIVPVGPEPGGAVPSGELVVSSAKQPNLSGPVEWNWEETRWAHSAYAIYRPDGSLYRKITNHNGPYDEEPQTVLLPSGRYIVRALSERDGSVSVPVLVKRGQLTRVKLDRSGNGND